MKQLEISVQNTEAHIHAPIVITPEVQEAIYAAVGDIQRRVSMRHVLANLDMDTLLVRSLHGNHYAVPSFNLDVGSGMARDGIIEPWTTEVVRRLIKPGQTFINVGSNFGYYPVLAASMMQRRGKVFAIEANPYVFCYLLKTVYWSGYPDIIRPYNTALWETAGNVLPLKFTPAFWGGGGLVQKREDGVPVDVEPVHVQNLQDAMFTGANIHNLLAKNGEFQSWRSPVHTLDVVTNTLDDIMENEGQADLIQLDIEGAEPGAIKGAQKLLNRSPDVKLIIEISPERNLERNIASKETVDDMLDILCGDNAMQIFRLCADNYPGVGALPKFIPVDPNNIHNEPHGDYLFTRGGIPDLELTMQ